MNFGCVEDLLDGLPGYQIRRKGESGISTGYGDNRNCIEAGAEFGLFPNITHA